MVMRTRRRKTNIENKKRVPMERTNGRDKRVVDIFEWKGVRGLAYLLQS